MSNEEILILELAKALGLPGLVLTLLIVVAYKYNIPLPKKFIFNKSRRPVEGVDLTISKINKCINAALYSILHHYDACRAYVFEYEGYDVRIKPLPWQTCSCTYEICNPTRTVTCERETLQDLPLDAISYWRDQLAENREICLHDADTLKDTDLESWKILTRQQVSSVYCVSLLNFRGLPIGFLGVDYCNGRSSKLKRSEDRAIFAYEAVKVAGLLAMKRNGTLEQLAGTL